MGPRKYRRNFFYEQFSGRPNYVVHDLGLCITARPAPRTMRPLAGLPNPYPYGCSVLCNHPRDPELKDVVWRPRMSSTHDSGAEHYDNNKVLKRTSRTGSASDGGAFIYHSGWDQKISGLGTLVEVGVDPLATAAQLAIRRCASGGPSPIERRSQKPEGMLVLDLRPWKSFDNVSTIPEGHHDALDNFERFELTSPRTRQEKPGRSNRSIRRPETFSSKSFKEGKKMPKQLSSKSRGMPPRNADLPMEGNNAMPGYETNSLSDSLHEMDINDGFPLAKLEDSKTFRESKGDEVFRNEINSQQQANGEPSPIQPTCFEEFGEHLRHDLIQDDHENEEEVETQMEEVIEDMTWLLFPRAGSTFGARFELPIDLRKLKTMTSLGYLSEYVVATRCRRRLNEVVFDRHSTTSNLLVEKLYIALTEILGFHLDPAAEENLTELVDLASITELSREQFAGIGALAERIGRRGISRRDDLEVSDFNILQQKLPYLEMGESLRRLFLYITHNTLESEPAKND